MSVKKPTNQAMERVGVVLASVLAGPFPPIRNTGSGAARPKALIQDFWIFVFWPKKIIFGTKTPAGPAHTPHIDSHGADP
jgi:hypothetical protein